MFEQLRFLVRLLLLFVGQLRMHDLLRDEVDLLGISWRIPVPDQEGSSEVASADAL